MAAEEFWASVEVKTSAKILQPATILSVSPEDTFGSLLGRVYSGLQGETVERMLRRILYIYIVVFVVISRSYS